MNIKHHPLFDPKIISDYYSNLDGVPVTYVCTSAPNTNANYAADIFYREKPHPKFGNRYFGIYQHNDNRIMIANADSIELVNFGMLEGPDGWEYSQHRHDYRQVGNCAIDGGRSYIKRVGNLSVPFKVASVKDGVFQEVVFDES